MVGEKDFDADHGKQPREIMSDDKVARAMLVLSMCLRRFVPFAKKTVLGPDTESIDILHVIILSEQCLGTMQD